MRIRINVPRTLKDQFGFLSLDVSFVSSEIPVDRESVHELSTILDLYALLYSKLKSLVHIYEDLLHYGLQGVDGQVRKEITALWEEHSNAFPYCREDELVLVRDTVDLIRNDLLAASNSEMLLIKSMNWVFALDKHFKGLKTYFDSQELQDTFPYETPFGDLIFKREAYITNYMRPYDYWINRNVDILHLRDKVSNMILVNHEYPTYNVLHQPLKPFRKRGKSEDIRFAFLPGNTNIGHYRWTIEDDTQSSKCFYATGVCDDYYEELIFPYIEEIFNENPDFIILPELFTPLDCQFRLREAIESNYINYVQRKKVKDYNLQLLIPGSFHELKSNIQGHSLRQGEIDFIYNYSLISHGNGSHCCEVYKMNQYKITRNPKYRGHSLLSTFADYDGIEKNSYNRRTITLIESALGRIAILICVDSIINHVRDILIDRHVDIIFIMCNTKNPLNTQFLSAITELGAFDQATILICNKPVDDDEDKTGVVALLPGAMEPVVIRNRVWEVRSLDQLIENFIGQVDFGET